MLNRVPDDIRQRAANFDLEWAAKIRPELNEGQLEVEMHKLKASLSGGIDSGRWLLKRGIPGTRSLLF